MKKIVDGVWQRRMNEELEEYYEEPNIVQVIKSQRMRWMGHIIRMKQGRIPRKYLQSKIGGRKRSGKPRARWLEEVQNTFG